MLGETVCIRNLKALNIHPPYPTHILAVLMSIQHGELATSYEPLVGNQLHNHTVS